MAGTMRMGSWRVAAYSRSKASDSKEADDAKGGHHKQRAFQFVQKFDPMAISVEAGQNRKSNRLQGHSAVSL